MQMRLLHAMAAHVASYAAMLTGMSQAPHSAVI